MTLQVFPRNFSETRILKRRMKIVYYGTSTIWQLSFSVAARKLALSGHSTQKTFNKQLKHCIDSAIGSIFLALLTTMRFNFEEDYSSKSKRQQSWTCWKYWNLYRVWWLLRPFIGKGPANIHFPVFKNFAFFGSKLSENAGWNITMHGFFSSKTCNFG